MMCSIILRNDPNHCIDYEKYSIPIYICQRIFLNFYNIFTTLQLFKWIDNLIQILENTTFSDSKGANFAIGYNI